jgi:hypothetical protein
MQMKEMLFAEIWLDSKFDEQLQTTEAYIACFFLFKIRFINI